MKCPICNSDMAAKATICPVCCFDDVRYEFINDEELRMWKTYVVMPCKYAYQLNNALKSEIEMLRKKVKELSSGNSSTQGTATSFAPLQAKVNMREGWNYSDPIAHPNSAVGKSYGINFSVSEIKAQMTSASTATITFLVRKENDDEGQHSAKVFWVRYRVKNKEGVIILNETTAINGLQVGDVSRETIKLKGVSAGEFTIDFVSYN